MVTRVLLVLYGGLSRVINTFVDICPVRKSIL